MKSRIPTNSTLVIAITSMCLIAACSPSGNTTSQAHVGTYSTRQVNSMMGEEITTANLILTENGGAEIEVRVSGELHGIGVTQVDDYFKGSGSWKLVADDEINVTMKKVAFTRRGEEKEITSLPVIIELDTSMQTVSFGKIEWDGGRFVVLTVQKWDFKPAE